MAGSMANMVCRIVGTSASGLRELGTGFYVSPTRVLTAAHVVWPQGQGSPVTSAKVLRLDGGSELIGADGIHVLPYYHTPPDIRNFHWNPDDFDVALLHLQHAIREFQPILRRVEQGDLNGSQLWALSIEAAGLPGLGDKWARGPGLAGPWLSFSRLFASYVAEPGFSGGPVVDNRGQIVGIHREGNHVEGVDGSIFVTVGKIIDEFIQLDGRP